MQEWKASEKEAQKMTRDGAISVNLVTGEATHISDRPQEQDYSSADETAGTLSRAVDEVEGHVERRQAKKARRKRRDTFREGEAARDRPSSRLQFSEADRAAPELKKAVRNKERPAEQREEFDGRLNPVKVKDICTHIAHHAEEISYGVIDGFIKPFEHGVPDYIGYLLS